MMSCKENVVDFSKIFCPHILRELVNNWFFGSFIDLIQDKIQQNLTVPKLFPLVENFRENRKMAEK